MTENVQWLVDIMGDQQKSTGLAVAKQPHQLPHVDMLKDRDHPQAGIRRRAHEDRLRLQSAWNVALGPAKSLPMNIFMSYMSGNSLQMVTISMTTYMFFLGPLRQIINVNETFAPFSGKTLKAEIFITKGIYVLCSLLVVAAGIWKVGQMGLLPNHNSDWVAWESPANYKEVLDHRQ